MNEEAQTPFIGFDVAEPSPLEFGSVYVGKLVGFKPFTYTDAAESDQSKATRQLVEWQFNVDINGGNEEVSGVTSMATGAKSKAFKWLTALMGASAVQPGAHFDPSDLIGREGQLTIGESKSNWPKVEEVTALPMR